MNYRFSNLLGAPYRGGTLLLHGDDLLAPVGNRVGQVRTLCVSPDGSLLLSIDEDGRALVINRQRRVLLHHFSFKGPVAAAKFSPDGQYLAVAVGRLMQVWRTPGFQKVMAPMELYRTYGQCHSDVTDLDWSPDSKFIAVASKDITARVFSLDPIPGYQPPTLSGHKDSLMGIFFTGSKLARLNGDETPLLLTLSREGALLAWSYEQGTRSSYPEPSARKRGVWPQGGSAPSGATAGPDDASAGAGDGEAGLQTEGDEEGGRPQDSGRAVGELTSTSQAVDFPYLAGGRWSVSSRHYLNQRGAHVSSHAWHAELGVLVIGLSSGIFEIYQMPEFASIQTLSIGSERITSMAFNTNGDWIAVGCAKLGQVLVWEWRSETYVLKQQGHHAEIAAAAFSPDGALLATGGDDRKVKVFNMSSGFCFVTFSEHSAPVTAVTFLPTGHAVLSASLDGTVRAYDLVRYRNFRTLAAPAAVQFGSLAVDPGGEIVCAGTIDTFQIYVWSLKTSRLLDVLAGHEGPVSCLSFSPINSELASSSWDKTVRIWDVFTGKGSTEVLQHSHDVLALAYRPDGKELAAATLDGQIYLWQPREGELQGTIEGRRDIKGGRLTTDRRAAGNLASGACFSSLVYSADGTTLLGGGMSKYVVIYDVVERLMLRRFQLSHNRGLDGVLDQLNSKHMTDAGPLALINHEEHDPDVELLPPVLDLAGMSDLPGNAMAAAKRPLLRSRCVVLSPTGRCWAAATTEGLMVFSMDDEIMFDPTSLSETITTRECLSLLSRGQHSRALTVALHLNDKALVHRVVMSTPPRLVATLARGINFVHVPALLAVLAAALTEEPHLEFLMGWVQSLARCHGRRLAAATTPSSTLMPIVRELQAVLNRTHAQLASVCEANLYTLDYLCTSGSAAAVAERPPEVLIRADSEAEEAEGSDAEDVQDDGLVLWGEVADVGAPQQVGVQQQEALPMEDVLPAAEQEDVEGKAKRRKKRKAGATKL